MAAAPRHSRAGRFLDLDTYPKTQGVTSVTNTVTNTGVVANDTTGVGTARAGLAAAGFGGDKAIFGYGYIASVTLPSL